MAPSKLIFKKSEEVSMTLKVSTLLATGGTAPKEILHIYPWKLEQVDPHYWALWSLVVFDPIDNST